MDCATGVGSLLSDDRATGADRPAGIMHRLQLNSARRRGDCVSRAGAGAFGAVTRELRDPRRRMGGSCRRPASSRLCVRVPVLLVVCLWLFAGRQGAEADGASEVVAGVFSRPPGDCSTRRRSRRETGGDRHCPIAPSLPIRRPSNRGLSCFRCVCAEQVRDAWESRRRRLLVKQVDSACILRFCGDFYGDRWLSLPF